MFACLVLTPLIYHFGSQIPHFAYAGKTYVIASMSSGEIFDEFVKKIGIGAIAVSAIFGIIRMGKIVLGSISLGFKGLKGGKVEAAPRTQTDMSPRNVLLIQVGSTLLMALLFFVVAHSGHGAAAGAGTAVGHGASAASGVEAATGAGYSVGQRLLCRDRCGGGLRPVVPLHACSCPGHRHRWH